MPDYCQLELVGMKELQTCMTSSISEIVSDLKNGSKSIKATFLMHDRIYYLLIDSLIMLILVKFMWLRVKDGRVSM